MSGELTYSILSYADLDEALDFYDALGFERTYLQRRPNPHAVVARDDLQIHLSGVDGFDPAASLGSVIVVVPDADELYAAFAAGLRARYGKLPSAGIPRLLRPRKRHGTVRGFSVVDPGGNWLRVSQLGDTEEQAKAEGSTGLARLIENAARLGDAKGSDVDALALFERGLGRFADAPVAQRLAALLYRAELAVRVDDRALAEASLAEAVALPLTDDERAASHAELAHAEELVRDM
jgi:catechol 2,3-dioxygenase-like lactoylglutathione lyase family enzyme